MMVPSLYSQHRANDGEGFEGILTRSPRLHAIAVTFPSYCVLLAQKQFTTYPSEIICSTSHAQVDLLSSLRHY
jgi:hypothetical protein